MTRAENIQQRAALKAARNGACAPRGLKIKFCNGESIEKTFSNYGKDVGREIARHKTYMEPFYSVSKRDDEEVAQIEIDENDALQVVFDSHIERAATWQKAMQIIEESIKTS